MANFVINQTADKIQEILNKAETPDTTPTINSQNLVESGGVKSYVDTQVSAGASITTASFAPSALEESTEGLTVTDTAIPTSAAVKDYVDTAVAAATPFNRLRIKLPPTSFILRTDLKLRGNGAYMDLDGSSDGTYPWFASCDIPDGYMAVSVTVTGDDTDFQVFEGNFSGALGTTSLGSGSATNPSSPLTVTFSSPVVGTDTNYITIGIIDGGGSGRFFGCYITLQAV